MTLENCAQLRATCRRIQQALPWLDATVWPEDRPAYPEFARPLGTDMVPERILKYRPALSDEPQIMRYEPQLSGPFDTLDGALDRLAEAGVPLAVRHTEVDFDRIAELAQQHPRLAVIIESGDRKILYHLEAVEKVMNEHENVYLSTFNFCNWLGIERLCGKGLGKRLLYGTHMPRFSADAAMAPIIMAQVSWEAKCDIAGNNLRRLLGLSLIESEEAPFQAPSPFIIDAHAHNLDADSRVDMRFPTPDEAFTPEDWLRFMDSCALDRLLLIPMKPLFEPLEAAPLEYTRALREAAPDRFFCFEVFYPDSDERHADRIRETLKEPGCIGIKIHPTTHEFPADDDRYETAFKLAAEADKPIMTHSWEVSTYNPAQHLSHPNRFRRWFEAFPQVRFVLGHAGGRPTAFDAVVEVCSDFPQVSVDIAGDYYDNGLVDALADGLGVERVLFASDMNWMDPRVNLGPVLGSQLDDAGALAVLRENARRVYRLD